MESIPAMIAGTARQTGVDLIIQLPADHIGIAAEFFGHGLHNSGAVTLIIRVAGAAMAAAAMGNPQTVGVQLGRFRIAKQEPPGRSSGGRTQDALDAVGCQVINDPVEPTKVKFTGAGSMLCQANSPMRITFMPAFFIISMS